MSFTLPWTVNKLVSTNINNANSITGTYNNVSLKVGGKTELSDATTIASLGVGKNTSSSYAVDVNGKINASSDISTGGNLITTGGITASGTQTINFGTNAPTMSGANISATSIPDTALSSNIPLKNASNTFTNTNTITPSTTAVTINNPYFATPAQSTNSYTVITDANNWTPAVTLYGWTFKKVVGVTAPTIRIGNGFTPFVNVYTNQFPEYPLFNQYISFNNNGIFSYFSISQNITLTAGSSYILTMYVFGEYNRYSPTQTVSVYIQGFTENLTDFTTIEGGWSKLVFKFTSSTTGTFGLQIQINSTTVDSGLSISGIQIVKQSGLIVSDGANTNNQLITPYGSYTSGSLYNKGSIINNGSFKNYGPLSLFLPYSSGSLVLGSSSYGMNISDKGKYNVLIGQQVAAAANPTQALNMNSCVAIGYAALEQGGLSTNGISRCTGVGYQANRWNATHYSTNCDDNCGVGYQSGAGLGYSDTNSARNCTFGNYVLAGAYGDSNDNSVFGFNSMSSYTGSGRSYNSCLGSSSLINCVSNYNSCLGYGSAANMQNTSSSYNTFVGAQVCPSQSDPDNVLTNCSFFGAKTDVIYSGNYSNSTCLGYNSRIAGDNGIFLGTENEATYAMGGLTIPLDRGLILFGNIIANYSIITPTQLSYLESLTAGIVSLDGAQTISGIKTFNSAPVMSGGSISAASIPDSALSSNVGLLTGTQTFSGAKTFTGGITASGTQTINFGTNAPTMSGANITFSAASIPDSALSSNVGLLTGTQTFSGAKTFTGGITATGTQTITFGTNAPTMSGDNITFSATSIPNSALQNSVILSSGSQTISGAKTFTGGITATGTQTITFGTNAPTMSGDNITFSATSIPNSALQNSVILSSGSQTISGAKTFTGGITATATQTINFGTNAPTMSGANISSASIPDSALSSNIPLENGTNTFTGANAINNQYVHAAYGSVITAAATLTTLSSIIYEYYSVSAGATAFTITLPTITSTNIGQLITFRRVGGTTTTIVSFTGNGTQLIYNTHLTGVTTATLLGSGIYIVKLVGLLVTGTTYAYFQV